MPLTSYHVTRMTEMGDILARITAEVRRPADKLFCKELILVDGKALSNWLSHYLVREVDLGDGRKGLGVHAHSDLLNTHRFAPWAAALLSGHEPGANLGDPLESLALRIHDILATKDHAVGRLFADCVGKPEVDGGMVRWEVSERLANRLRELTLDDPNWTLRAQTNPGDDRLGLLWKELRTRIVKSSGRQLVSPTDVMHLLETDEAACELLRCRLPGYLTLLASGDIPRTLLRSLAALGRADTLAVHGIFLQPTLGFHQDLRKWQKLPEGLNTPGADFIRQTAEHFQNQFSKLVDSPAWNFGEPAEDRSHFPATLLGSLQQSIAQFDQEEARFDLSADPDRSSVTIHRCHSVVREVEVLRDELLAAMSQDPTIRPRDVLILSPDPETYASLVQGIFRDRQGSDIYVTHVALEGTSKSELATLAEALLALPAGRCTSEEVMALCELKVVRDRFGWDAGDTATIKEWFRAAPFFWGADAAHRERLTQVAYDEWSLADFRRRLVLGTALAPDVMLAGEPASLPLDAVEGKQGARLAAELIEFTDLLRDWINDAHHPRPLESWCARFSLLVSALLPQTHAYAEETAKMERALGSLCEQGKQGSYEPASLSLFAAFAQPMLDLDHGKGQFMSGGAVLAPLRSSSIHPAKIIALLGMKDGSYPVRGQSPGPELKSTLAQESERQKKQSEQRGMHAVLLAIGAARHRLIATFPGYAGASGKEASAALPVELIKQACDRILQKEAKERFRLRRHGIHAHEAAEGTSSEFGQEHTFDTHAVAAAKTLNSSIPEPEPLQITPSRPFDTWSADEWVGFWEDPAKGLFNYLDLRTVWVKDSLQTDEALVAPRVEGKLSDAEYDAKYAALDWVRDYLERSPKQADGTPTPPTRDEAILSGHFSAHEDGELAIMLKELEEKIAEDWPSFMEENYFSAPPQPIQELLPSYHSQTFPEPYVFKDWLVLTLPDGILVNDKHLFPSLAMLGCISKKLPQLRNVAIFGAKKRTRGDETYTDRGALAVQVGDPDTLFSRLTELAKQASTDQFYLGKKATAECAKLIMSDDLKSDDLKPKEPETFEEEFFGSPPYRGGDNHDRFGRLLAPSRYVPELFVQAMTKALGGNTRLTDNDFKKLFKEPPAPKQPKKPKQPK
ncbi:MAG: exodeoxyribonuclease subunit gamma [Verrucomicrobiota bacterium]